MSKHLAAIFTLLLAPLGSCPLGCSQPQADEANSVQPADTSKPKRQDELVQCFEIKAADHFNTLAPISQLIAKKILQDQVAETNIAFTDAELSSAMRAK